MKIKDLLLLLLDFDLQDKVEFYTMIEGQEYTVKLSDYSLKDKWIEFSNREEGV